MDRKEIILFKFKAMPKMMNNQEESRALEISSYIQIN